MVGRSLSHYKLLEEISRGGMGIVHRARDTKLDRDVALKVLPPGLTADPERAARFMREARAAAALQHPNIAVVHEIGESDGTTYLAMELIEGEPLSNVIESRRLSTETAVAWAKQILEGLEAAHAKGIVHRDLKPANVMIDSRGHAKLIDFGLAKLTERDSADDSDADTRVQMETAAGRILGTVAYMSPEQARGQPVDQRSDLFSVGIMLYEMLTGAVPFRGDDQLAVWNAIVGDEPAPISTVPAELDRIVRRALAKALDERYQTAADLLAELRAFERHSDPEGPARPEPQESRATQWKMLAGVGAVLALILVAFFSLQRSAPPEIPRLSVGVTRQLTFDPGPELHPALSPDGTLVAYAAGQRGRKLYVRQIDGERTIPLTEEFPGDHEWPQWSPDGTRILFQSDEVLYFVPSLGGQPRRFADGESASWSRDGSRIAYAHDDTLYLRPVDGGEPTALASLEGQADFGQPHSFRWSPDGNWLAYVDTNGGYVFGAVIGNVRPAAIRILSTRDGTSFPVTGLETMSMSPIWTPGGDQLLYVSNEGGKRDIYAVLVDLEARTAGEPTRLTTGLDPHTIDLSLDGRKLVYSVYVPRSNAWAVPVGTHEESTSADAVPVTRGNEYIEGVVVSPDGEWLGVDSLRSGVQQIYKVPIDGGAPQQLSTGAGDKFLYSWSSDADRLAYHAYLGEEPDIYTISSDGGSVEQVTDQPSHDREPDLSPDGNHVVFSVRESDATTLHIVSRHPESGVWGSPRQLTSLDSTRGRWSPDGSQILFSARSGDARALYVISPGGGRPEKLWEYPVGGNRYSTAIWFPDGETILFRVQETTGGATSFWTLPAAGGSPRRVAILEAPRHQTRGGIQFSTDGERIYFAGLEQEADIEVAELEDPRGSR